MDKKKIKPKIKEVLKAFARLVKWGYKASPRAMIMLLIFMFLVSITPFIDNYLNSQVIDEVVKLLGIPVENRILQTLVLLIISAVTLSLLERFFWVAITYFEKKQFFDVPRYFTLKFLEKASSLDMYHYENVESNKIIQKARDIYEWKPREAINKLSWMVGDIIQIMASLVIVLSFSFPAFLLVLFTSLPNLIVNLRMGNDSWGIWDADAMDRKKYSWTRDQLAKEETIMELRIFRTTNYLLEIVQGIYDKFATKERKNQIKKSVTESLVGNLSTIGILAFWIIAVFAALNGQITIGLLSFYVSSINRFSNSLSNFFRNLGRQYEDSLYIIDFFKFQDLQNSIVTGTKKLLDKSEPPFISFKNVSFKYPGHDKYVLKNFNLDIEPGSKIALVGVNGSGKTTIIKLLCRFYDVTEGELLVDGENIKDVDYETWYKKIGVLFQEFVRYGQFDVKNNIELGDMEKIGDEKKLNEAIYKADAQGFINEYDHKLEQILSRSFEGGINPSGGQWQRIALARAFFRDAKVLILDEPTSAIDAKGEYEIFQRLYEFSKGKSVIIVSHRFSTVRKADKIYIIDGGKIIESGTHEELIKLNGKYAETFNTQAEGYR